MALEKEYEVYQKNLSDLLSKGKEGQYVLIHGDEIVGIYENYEEGLTAGYQKFGLDSFFIKKIQWAETVYNFTRDMVLCK